MVYATEHYVVSYDETTGDYVLERLPDTPGATETDETETDEGINAAVPAWVNEPHDRLSRIVPGALVAKIRDDALPYWWQHGAWVETVSHDRKTARLVRVNRKGNLSRRTVATDAFEVWQEDDENRPHWYSLAVDDNEPRTTGVPIWDDETEDETTQ